ncbi:hypothetical protein BDA96_07G057600 [Sorghum bicolor]|uniref:Uncharacterized protein n=1 Tax=Sorghum bicolor TaxID=4558 RepID=A0A921U9I7_SORBI|nr:hypothetical protein BDA96_07G057600 [Sorghum bicolor]
MSSTSLEASSKILLVVLAVDMGLRPKPSIASFQRRWCLQMPLRFMKASLEHCSTGCASPSFSSCFSL